MLNRDIQMKHKRNGIWDNLFPITRTKNVYNDEGVAIQDTITKVEQSAMNTLEPVLTPEGFRWRNHPLRNKLFTDGKGNFQIKGFDVSSYQPIGKTYYVDKHNGLDTNDGLTLNTALKTLNVAYGKADCRVILVASGVYYREEILHGVQIKKQLSIKAIKGHNVTFTTASIMENIREHAPNIYFMSTSQVSRMVDLNYLDAEGDYAELERVSTLAELSTKAGTFFHDGSKIYMRMLDNREPTNDDVLRLLDGTILDVVGASLIYLEDIAFLGGTNSVRVDEDESGRLTSFYMKDCSFRFSSFTSQGNLVGIRKAHLAVLQNCNARKSGKDGFHYDGLDTNILEINCVGYENGPTNSGSNQGSTTHSGTNIIRVNGLYYGNTGSGIGDDGNVHSWNLGSISHTSNANNSTQKANFISYEGVKMWLDGNLGYGSDYDLSGGGEVLLRNNQLLSTNVAHEMTTISNY